MKIKDAYNFEISIISIMILLYDIQDLQSPQFKARIQNRTMDIYNRFHLQCQHIANQMKSYKVIIISSVFNNFCFVKLYF